MQVRICPKCKAENKITNASCSSCYASLEGALLKDATGPAAPPAHEAAGQPKAAAAPTAVPSTQPPMPVTGGPSPAAAPPPTGGPSPYGSPPSVYSPPVRESKPVRQGPNVVAIVLIILLIGGAGFGGWWFLTRAQSPAEVVGGFVEAVKAGDGTKAKSFLTAGNVRDLERPGPAAVFAKNLERGKDQHYEIGDTTNEGDSTAVVKLDVTMADNRNSHEDLVLVKEEGKWKIDLQQTFIRSYLAEMKQRGRTIPPSVLKQLQR